MQQSNNIVLITGASSGMGRQTAIYLSKQGFMVYAGSRTPEKLSSVESVTLKAVFLDITSYSSIMELVEKIGHIDVLINNAGYGLISTVEQLDEEEMFNQFNVNVFGVLRVCKAVIPFMRKQESGIIINISSFLGKVGLPLLTMYNASKYAVEGITDSLRYELKDFNIRVHSLLPGFFDTEFSRTNLVSNVETIAPFSPYASLVKHLAPTIIEQINSGNDVQEVAKIILEIIMNHHAPIRCTVGEKASKFIPMRRELSDEDFERRVREYYNL
jgi:short-subunit dehydrogenase